MTFYIAIISDRQHIRHIEPLVDKQFTKFLWRSHRLNIDSGILGCYNVVDIEGKTSQKGYDYYLNLYSVQAQTFIFDNLRAIIDQHYDR